MRCRCSSHPITVVERAHHDHARCATKTTRLLLRLPARDAGGNRGVRHSRACSAHRFPRSSPRRAGPTCCRSTISAVGVRMVGSAADAEARQAIDLQLCDPAEPDRDTHGRARRRRPCRPLAVREGHGDRLRPLRARIRRAGAAMPIGARGSVTRRAARAEPAWPRGGGAHGEGHEGRQPRRSRCRSPARSPAPRSGSCWGRARTRAGRRPSTAETHGDSTLVNGYANGWLVNPGSSSFSVTLDWTPQRPGVDRDLDLRRRDPAVPLPGAPRRCGRDAGGAADAAAGTGCVRASRSMRDGEVSLGNPLVAAGTRPPRARQSWRPIAAALVGAFVASWWVGLLARSSVCWPCCSDQRLRAVLAFGAPARVRRRRAVRRGAPVPARLRPQVLLAASTSTG